MTNIERELYSEYQTEGVTSAEIIDIYRDYEVI